ncbi:hypothetical protein BR93DRAFT_757443 [Coniochaeta sp. PMI_546]|nr:hypothetical protein BR93DRAFT_757443 [Coniochaeta sp. PMI_546]
MPTQDRRATYQSRYEPEYSDYDSYSEDEYPTERRPRPRRKSTTRDIIDRVSRSIGRLGINRSPSRTRRARVISPSPSPPPPRRPAYNRHRSAENYYPPSPRPRNKRHGSCYSVSPPRSRSSTSRSATGRDRTPVDNRRFQHAARSALDAAVVEIMRVRKEPGSWTGGKGARVATAALGAAAVDAFVAKDPDKHGKRKTVESTIGGLLLNRVLNGPRRELRKESRSRR